MKTWCFFILLTSIVAGNIYSGGLTDVNAIPDLEVQINIPPELIGEFEFPLWNNIPTNGQGCMYYVIEIHENNKFLWKRTSPDLSSSDQGYVIEEGGEYYFIPCEGYWGDRNYHIIGKTKITLTDNGFTFVGFGNQEFVAVRKRESVDSRAAFPKADK